jgi:hypothetical protein
VNLHDLQSNNKVEPAGALAGSGHPITHHTVVRKVLLEVGYEQHASQTDTEVLGFFGNPGLQTHLGTTPIGSGVSSSAGNHRRRIREGHTTVLASAVGIRSIAGCQDYSPCLSIQCPLSLATINSTFSGFPGM